MSTETLRNFFFSGSSGKLVEEVAGGDVCWLSERPATGLVLDDTANKCR